MSPGPFMCPPARDLYLGVSGFMIPLGSPGVVSARLREWVAQVFLHDKLVAQLVVGQVVIRCGPMLHRGIMGTQ